MRCSLSNVRRGHMRRDPSIQDIKVVETIKDGRTVYKTGA